MSRFWYGFLTASVLWGLGVFLYFGGVLVVGHHPAAAVAPAPAPVADAPTDTGHHHRRHHHWRRRNASAPAWHTTPAPQGNATTGDSLGAPGAETLNMGQGGGPQQLTGSQIEQGFDTVFNHVRRCFVLAAGDQALHGKVTFGLRIESSGRVTKVNLSGPAAVTTGDCGNCLRTTARGIHFPSFDGPTMIVHYPVTLD